MFEIGEIYRYPNKKSAMNPSSKTLDGVSNYFYETDVSASAPNYKSTFYFRRGIFNAKRITGPDGQTRIPVIIISSSPHKAGSEDTPWQDNYNPDNGYVSYYGDQKCDGGGDGNRLLLAEMLNYQSGNQTERERAIPVIFFERVRHNGASKGYIKFQGFGIIESAELVTQYDVTKGRYFTNYRFDFCVFSLSDEGEAFSWDWIAARADDRKTLAEANKFAPESWKRWVNEGSDKLQLVRRTVSTMNIIPDADQKLLKGDPHFKLLNDIYNHYTGKKHEFEYLALEVTRNVIENSGAKCVPGWVTKKSGDGGVDFVLRIDIGSEKLAGLKVIVLGQAKCTTPSTATNGNDIARTVARLKRGWIGSFVTTSYFTKGVQAEVNEDQYPIMLINGKTVAEIVERALLATGLGLDDYLDGLTKTYDSYNGIPEDILRK